MLKKTRGTAGCRCPTLIHTGADPGFQDRGVYIKNCAERREARKYLGLIAEIVGVFRVKNHDFMPKNHIFSNFRGGAHATGAPPLGSAPDINEITYLSATRD